MEFNDWLLFGSQIIRMGIVDAGGHLYSRLVPLILLLADGRTFSPLQLVL